MNDFNPQDEQNPFAGESPPAEVPVKVPLSRSKWLADGLNLTMLAMIVVTAGGLFFLVRQSGPSAASADQKLMEQKVDLTLRHLENSRRELLAGGKEEDIVERFYEDPSSRQIPQDELNTNPFRFKAPPSMQQVRTEENPSGRLVNAEEWKVALAAAQKLKLQSVLSGNGQTLAMISNNLLTVGEEIEGWKIESIDARSVTLRWRDRTYLLEMPDAGR
jgi:hypothetical protein